jgi:hypothetical protein
MASPTSDFRPQPRDLIPRTSDFRPQPRDLRKSVRK